ncbi:Maf-like protein, putative [Eimeria acervulina]|uniref:Maf-like protein, putative n=1 Tax=Eimeria acervulina TaxID=5801 RepID=U6GJG1_EIMAC|nr:Maf-like protein, putative [Eimeria acervulina]CDI78729.1 Maf-like protein, putative [Eimeria acervulina]
MGGNKDEDNDPTPGYVYKFPQPTDFPKVQEMAIKDCSLLLATSSLFRRELFARAAIPFGAFSAPFDEDDVQEWLEVKHPQLGVDSRTLLIAHMKADAAVHALRVPDTQHLQQLRLQNQMLNIPAAERLPLLQRAEAVARRNGRAAAAVAQLASFSKSCMAVEAADGRAPVLVAVDTGIEFGGRVRFKPKDKEEAARFLKSYSDSDEPIVVTTSFVLVDLVSELERPPWNPNAPVPAKQQFPHKCKACNRFQRSQPTDDPNPCTCPLTVVHAADILLDPGGPSGYHFHTREMLSVKSEVKFNKMNDEVRQRILDEGEVMYSAGAVLVERGEMAKYLKSISGCPHNVIGVPLSRVESYLSLLIGRMENR